MASHNTAPDPEPLFPLEPGPEPSEPGDSSGITPTVVPFAPRPKDSDGAETSGGRPRRKRTPRRTTRRTNMPKAAAIPADGDRYVSLAEAAALFGVSAETLRRRISEGVLPANKGGYNLIRVLLSNVAKLFPPMPTVDPDDYPEW